MGFERVAAAWDLAEYQPYRYVVDGVPLCIVRIGDDVHALHDTCSHQEYALSAGKVYKGEIECDLHGSMFSLQTGKPAGPPALNPVPLYKTKVDEHMDIYVDVTDQINDAPVPDH